MKKIQFIVTTIESEAGWGRSYDESAFDTYEKAVEYRDRINSYNTAKIAPSWYMIAEREIKVREV